MTNWSLTAMAIYSDPDYVEGEDSSWRTPPRRTAHHLYGNPYTSALRSFNEMLNALTTEPWMRRATCSSSIDPDAWFPSTPDGAKAARVETLCRTCPVRPECYTYALERQEIGVWGGRLLTRRSYE